MATRAANPRKSTADWRAGLRRSIRRTVQMTAAGLLLLAMMFVALSLISYTQTDPSSLTAASGNQIGNWMGRSGAWVSNAILLYFGLPGVLLLPLFYISARKLWHDVEHDGDLDAEDDDTRWWAPLGMLLLAMVLLSSVLALAIPTPGWTLPAQLGGLSGLLGASAIEAVANRFGGGSAGWIILGTALIALAGGVALLTRVFAIDWRALLTLPDFFHTGPVAGTTMGRILSRVPGITLAQPRLARSATDHDDGEALDGDEPDARPRSRQGAKRAPVIEDAPRRSPEITDPSAPPKRAAAAKAPQRDMFATFDLPPLDLLAEPPPNSAPALDKMALERNARLLENVLDDFNVKGEITAVRTGPVVTMYELEPAPGIKASRVIGLAEDIARNMSAISARVSTIPGKTVIGIELPNADRQMVVLKELAAVRRLCGEQGQPAHYSGQGHRRRTSGSRPRSHASPAGRRDHRIG